MKCRLENDGFNRMRLTGTHSCTFCWLLFDGHGLDQTSRSNTDSVCSAGGWVANEEKAWGDHCVRTFALL